MPKEVYLIKVGMSMTEGMVSEWVAADGARVSTGDLLYHLETEKVAMEVEAEADGTLRHAVAAGVTLAPGDVVGYIYEAGEEKPDDIGALAAAPATVSETAPVPDAAPPVAQAPTSVPTGAAKAGPDNRRIKSSPAARRLANELSFDYSVLEGSGPGGRIVKADVEAAASGTVPMAGPQSGAVIAVKGIRRTIARRMKSSLDNSAQLTMDAEAKMDSAVKLRADLVAEWEEEGIRPSYTDLCVKAAAMALQKHPMMNSVFNDTEISLLREVNIGIAVAIPDGLLVPVVRDAAGKSIKEIALETARLARAAREGTLAMGDYAGGTFTISTLGMYGIQSFTPIINEPQVGILGVNRLYDGVEWDGNTPVKTKKMNLSLTWDHQVLDGVPAAEFLQEVIKSLDNPFRLLL